jgi:hypothetical protein
VADADLEKPFFAAADRRLFSHSLTARRVVYNLFLLQKQKCRPALN